MPIFNVLLPPKDSCSWVSCIRDYYLTELLQCILSSTLDGPECSPVSLPMPTCGQIRSSLGRSARIGVKGCKTCCSMHRSGLYDQSRSNCGSAFMYQKVFRSQACCRNFLPSKKRGQEKKKHFQKLLQKEAPIACTSQETSLATLPSTTTSPCLQHPHHSPEHHQ